MYIHLLCDLLPLLRVKVNIVFFFYMTINNKNKDINGHDKKKSVEMGKITNR